MTASFDWEQYEKPNEEGFDWTKYEKPKEESFADKATRTIAQVPQGLAEGTPLGLTASAWELLGLGESLAELDDLEERLPDLKKKFPHLNWPEKIDKQKYMESVEAAIHSVPSVRNLASFIEDKTGAPLSPETGLQKGTRFLSGLTSMGTGTLPDRIMTGVKGMIMNQALNQAGVPEPISEAMSMYYAMQPKTPKVKVKEPMETGIAPIVKEAEKEASAVAPAEVLAPEEKALSKRSLEEDFRKFTDEMFSQNRTYSAIKEDPGFKNKIAGLFEDVEKIAEGMTERIRLGDLHKIMVERFRSRGTQGITESEAEKTFKKAFAGYVKDIHKRSLRDPEATIKDLLAQYRKNSAELAKFFEPGKSPSYNQGKRDALLEYNRAIQDVFEKYVPESEFNDLFKFSNKRWQEINDVETIEGLFEDLFAGGKINFNKARKFLNKKNQNLRRPFQRLLGEEGFKDFEGLMEQFVSFQEPYSLIKKVEAEGWKELGRLAKTYLFDPKFSKLGAAGHIAGRALKIIINKPKVARLWTDALKDLKARNYAKAEAEFKQLDREVKSGPTSS